MNTMEINKIVAGGEYKNAQYKTYADEAEEEILRELWTNAASALLRSSAFGDLYSVSQKASKVRSSASPIAECAGVHDYGAVQVSVTARPCS